MQDNQVKILLIEDNAGDVRLIREMLKDSAIMRYELLHADCLTSGMEHLAKSEYDVLLLDLGLPESQGLLTLDKILSLSMKPPIVVLTGIADEMSGVMAIQKGIQDYLVKGRFDTNLLTRSIRYAIERKKLQDELVKSNEFLEQRVLERTSALEMANKKLQLKIEELWQIYENNPDAILVLDRDFNVTYVNQRAEDIFGVARSEFLGKRCCEAIMGNTSFCDEYMEEVIREKKTKSRTKYEMIVKGKTIWLSQIWYPLLDLNGEVASVIEIARDITDINLADEKISKLSHAVEQSPVSIMITDISGNLEYVNPKFTQITGYTKDEVLGKNTRILKTGETQAEEYKYLWETITSGNLWQGIFHNRKKTGELYWESAVISPIKNSRGVITNFMAIKEDISNRKHAEQHLSAQHAVTKILAETDSIAKASPGIFRAICECLEWDIGELWMIDSLNNVLRLAESWHLPSVKAPEFEAMSREITFSPGVGLPGRVWTDGKPFWITDVTKDSNFPRAATAAKEGLHGAFCFPVIVEDEILGVMDFFSCKTRSPDNDLLSMMEAIGRQIGMFIKRWQAEEAFKHISHRNELILNSAGEGIYGVDREGCVTFINPMAAKMLGWGIDELIGKVMHTIVHHSKPDGTPYPSEECPIFATLRDRTVRYIDTDVFWRKDAVKFPVKYVSTPIVKQDKVFGAVVTFEDITERKQLVEKLCLQITHFSVLQNIGKAISSSLNLTTVLDVLKTCAVTELLADAMSVLLYNPRTQLLKYTDGFGFYSPRLQHGRMLPLGEDFCGRAARERHPVYIPNLREESCGYGEHLSMDESFVSYYAIPLIAKGQLKGVLEFLYRRMFHPEREWLRFVEILAEQMAIAINNTELYENLQHTNTELLQAYDKTIEGWSRALDLRDKETEGHSRRVTEMTTLIAVNMGVSKSDLVYIRWGALLHDIGKMGVPDRILLKVEPLTDEEWIIMSKHPVYAYEMLSPIVYLGMALDIPFCHHEKWDGTGYPRGLKGEQIPLCARIFAVADVWDAMCSDRPYRKGLSKEKVREHIKTLAGTHFDPKVVDVFCKIKQ